RGGASCRGRSGRRTSSAFPTGSGTTAFRSRSSTTTRRRSHGPCDAFAATAVGAAMRRLRAADVRLPKLWQHRPELELPVAEAQPHDAETRTVIELDADQLRQLSAVFSAPRWLRDLGVAAWLLVGVAALLVGLTWVFGITSTIMIPVIVGLVISTVASPAVSWLHSHHWPRALGALLVLLFVVAIAV